MFKIDDMIDQVQNSKKTIVGMMFTDEKIAVPMTKAIDAQTEYAKATADLVTNMTPSADTINEFWKDAFKSSTYFPSKKTA